MPAPPPAPDEFTFHHPLRVRWSEVDAQGVVFNPNYLVYFDIGLTEYMRAVGSLAFSSDTYLVHAGVDFRSPARYDDELRVGVRVAAFGRTSLRVRLAVFRGAEALVDGEHVYVHAPGEARRPLPLPDEFTARVRAFERAPPA